MTQEAIDYQFLLLTHMVCADQQIHSEEAKALRELGNQAQIGQQTLNEMEKIIAQEDNHFSVEYLANQVPPGGKQNETMRQLLAIAYIDGYFAPLEREMVNQICSIWHWTKKDRQRLLEEAGGFKPTRSQKDNNDLSELSFAARLLRNEKRSPLSRAILNFASQVAPETVGQTIQKLEREILLAGPEYDDAIEQCAKIAKEDYEFAEKALKDSYFALHTLGVNLKKTIEQIQQKTNNQGQANTAKEVAKQLESSRKALTAEIIKELENVRESLRAKQRALNHFSIAFMGKTKAGKSTLHAIVTGEGWDAIGVGKQRTTRLNRVYEWKNVRIIDTPGIGAPGGRSDEEIARSVIDESDVICYVVTNDSVQETEFQFMKLLKEKAKPLIILLNVKYNLRDSRRLKHFLKKPDKFFEMKGNSGLQGHFERIHRYAKEHYANDYFSIIPVMLLAAQMSREPEQQELKDNLFKASKMQDFLDSIRESLIKYGAIRRSQTLLGSTVGSIDSPNKWLTQELEAYQKLTHTLKNKRQEIKDKIKKAEDDNYRWLKAQINAIFLRANNHVQGFAESHWEDNEQQLNSAWKKEVKKIRIETSLKEEYETAGKKFNKDVEIAIKEIGQELQLIAQLSNVSSFNLKSQNNDSWVQGVQQGLKIAGVGLMVAGFAFPPLAPLVVVGIVVSIVASFLKSKEKKRRESVQKIRDSLTNQLNDYQNRITADLKNKFSEYCSSTNAGVTQYFDDLIEGLQLITTNLDTALVQLNSSKKYLNCAYGKRILDWCLDQYEPLSDEGITNSVAQVERDFGQTLTIHPKSEIEIKKSQAEIKQVLQEDIIFKFNQD